MDNLTCCICLSPKDNTVPIDSYNTGESLIVKLQNVVPDVDWLNHYIICESCLCQLNGAHEFRNMCIKLDQERKSILMKDEEVEEHKPIVTKDHNLNQADDCLVTGKRVQKHRRRSFSCEVCNQMFKQAKLVIEHCIKDHSMDKKLVQPYACDMCPMRFSTSTNIIQHEKYHEGVRSHICSFCGKSYITKSDLTVHESIHFNKRNYKCQSCDKSFNTNKNLYTHKLVVHTDSNLWKYACSYCSRRFPLKSGYDQHVKRHTGNKEFVCHICAKPFVTNSELQKHVQYHSTVRAYRCSHCDKAYKEKKVYEIHLSRVHGVGDAKIPVRMKNFVCHVCPKTFCERNKLERHLRTHSGLKPYVCKGCDKQFADKYYLKQHMKNVHNIEEEG